LWRTWRLFVVAALIGGSAALTSTYPGPAVALLDAESLAKTYDEVVYGDFVVIGNGNMQCPTTPSTVPSPQPSCAGGADRTNDAINDVYDMQYADVDSDVLTFNSSTSELMVPPGATVDYARLYWAGSTGHVTLADGSPYSPACSPNAFSLNDPAELPASAPETQALRVTVGSGATQSVLPQSFVSEPAAMADLPQYYSASADIAPLLSEIEAGTPVAVTVGDIWTPRGLNCFGGWSLTVVYKFPGPDATYAPTPRQVYVYEGHVRQDPSTSSTTVSINGFSYAGGPVHVGNTAYEGDWGIGGDQILVNGAPLAEPSTGSNTNYLVGSSQGALVPDVVNNFSVDAKSTVLPDGTIAPGATSLDLGLVTGGDSYLEQQLVLSVPLPELDVAKEVCQTSDPIACGSGGSGPWVENAVLPTGSTAYWRITVSNPSIIDIADATLSDPTTPACVTAAGTFSVPAGQSVQFRCASPNLTEHTTNTALALFLPPGAPPGAQALPTAPDSATVDVYGLTIVKLTCQSLNPVDCAPGGVGPWVSTTTIPTGGTAYWQITVTDTGSIPVQGLTVEDPMVPGCVTQSRDIVFVSATSRVYYCWSTNVTSTMTNTATATYTPPGSPPGTPPTTVPSSATVTVADLALVKEVCTSDDEDDCGPGGDGPWAKSTAVAYGADAHWRIRVSNVGEVDLTGITLNDAVEPSCAAAAGTFDLGEGESTSFFCSTADLTTAKTNTVTASFVPPGTPPGTPPVTTPPDSATAQVHGLVVLKETCPSRDSSDCSVDGAGPWGPLAVNPFGRTAFWRITLTNIGTVGVEDVDLVDTMDGTCFPDTDETFALTTGSSFRFVCATPNVTEGVVNTVTASYLPSGAPQGTARSTTAPSTATVRVSDLAVSKEVCRSASAEACADDEGASWAEVASIPSGGTAFWRITVTNTGEVGLTGVTVTDPAELSCQVDAFDLAAGASRSILCWTDDVTTSMTNTVTAHYVPPDSPLGEPTVDTEPDSAAVNVHLLTVHKEVCLSLAAADCAAGGTGPWAANATIPPGSTAFWRITVTNTGELDLVGITLVDPDEASCVDTADTFSLAHGESTRFYCSTSNVTATRTNTAAAGYTPPGGNPTTTPPSHATANVPALAVVKEICLSATPADCGPGGSGTWTKTATITAGATLYWRITVSNTGTVPVLAVQLRDVNEPSCVTAAGTFDLAVGAVKYVYCSTGNVTGNFTNIATAVFRPEGVPVDEPPVVTPEDSAGGQLNTPPAPEGPGPLAWTGFSLLPWGALGAALLLAGLILVGRAAKRRT
jgi:predicted secreted protein